MPRGSNMRVRRTSANGIPAGRRAASTPSTDAPVYHSQRWPGWARRGNEPKAAIQLAGSGWSSGLGGPRVLRCKSAADLPTGHGSRP